MMSQKMSRIRQYQEGQKVKGLGNVKSATSENCLIFGTVLAWWFSNKF